MGQQQAVTQTNQPLPEQIRAQLLSHKYKHNIIQIQIIVQTNIITLKYKASLLPTLHHINYKIHLKFTNVMSTNTKESCSHTNIYNSHFFLGVERL